MFSWGLWHQGFPCGRKKKKEDSLQNKYNTFTESSPSIARQKIICCKQLVNFITPFQSILRQNFFKCVLTISIHIFFDLPFIYEGHILSRTAFLLSFLLTQPLAYKVLCNNQRNCPSETSHEPGVGESIWNIHQFSPI